MNRPLLSTHRLNWAREKSFIFFGTCNLSNVFISIFLVRQDKSWNKNNKYNNLFQIADYHGNVNFVIVTNNVQIDSSARLSMNYVFTSLCLCYKKSITKINRWMFCR